MASRLAGLLEASPLRHAGFRRYYYGSVGTALGFTILSTAAAWLMATLTPSALMVALVQTASTLPTLIFGLVAGALADLVDRRRIIIGTQVAMMSTGIVLGLLTQQGWMSPTLLLLLILVVGSAFTFYLPASGAAINEMVGRQELPRAVALGAVAFNVSRAIGPALAGFVAAGWGTPWAMFLGTLCFVPMFIGVRSVKPAEGALAGVPETLFSGVMTGVRYARHSVAMRSFLIRNFAFAACASAVWALLPVIARDQLGLGAGGFGLLYGMFGAGAVVSALLMPGQLQRRSLTSVVTYAVLLWTVAVLLIAATRLTPVALLGSALAGVAWVGTLASLGAGTQSAAPAWVRARAMAINLLAVQASLAIGSAVWGALASAFGTQTTLFLSAGVTVLLHFLIRHVRVNLGQEADVTTVEVASMGIKAEPLPNDGPVLVQVEYRIDPHHVPAFIDAIKAVGATRRRNGASDWRIFRDLGEDGKFVERYIVGSWAEYIRLRARMTLTDRRIQEKAYALQRPGIDIRVSRLINVDPDGDPGRHVARPRKTGKTSDTFLRPETEHPDPDQVHPQLAGALVATAAATDGARPDDRLVGREVGPLVEEAWIDPLLYAEFGRALEREQADDWMAGGRAGLGADGDADAARGSGETKGGDASTEAGTAEAADDSTAPGPDDGSPAGPGATKKGPPPGGSGA